MTIQLLPLDLALPHSSEWDAAFPGFSIEWLRGAAYSVAERKVFTPDGATQMPTVDDLTEYERYTLWRATSKTVPGQTFTFCTWDSGNQWEVLEGVDDPALMARSLATSGVEEWALAGSALR